MARPRLSPPFQVICALIVLSAAPHAFAADIVIDLSGAGSSGSHDGVLFSQYVLPSGTGSFNTFLALSNNSGIEQAYNTSQRPFQNNSAFDNRDANHAKTRSFQMSELQKITIMGVDYREIVLDVNESNSDPQPLISLDQLQLFTSSNGSLNIYDSSTRSFGGSASLIYDLDSGLTSGDDRYIKLDANLSSGSGGSDMRMLVPESKFSSTSDFVYLFSRFGDHFAADNGFEEWGSVTPIPEPSVVALSVLGVIGVSSGLWMRRRAQKAAARADEGY